MRSSVRIIIDVAALAIVVFILLRLVVGIYSVASESMQPKLQIGEQLLINKMAYSFGEPTRGDIVYYKSPQGQTDQLKRVIGLPGDVIEIKNNSVYVNGIKLVEPYVNSPPKYTSPEFQVPPNNYFLLEDNRNKSKDSSIDVTILREDIQGRAWLLTWPPDKWGTVDGYPLDSELTLAQVP